MHAHIIIPIHDPECLVLPHLQNVSPLLEQHFDGVIASITPQTWEKQAHLVEWLSGHPFYNCLQLGDHMTVGDQFRALYSYAAQQCAPQDALHLAFPDRLSFALSSDEHRQDYLADVDAIQVGDLPLLFQRSKNAWASHPITYRELEGIATRVGELLFHKELDFGWCYMVIHAQQLEEIITRTKTDQLSVLAEILIPLRDQVHVRNVDWLAWEDPFITGRPPQELAAERAIDKNDHLKRLSYVVPILELLVQATG